jgi:hypothetical protein
MKIHVAVAFLLLATACGNAAAAAKADLLCASIRAFVSSVGPDQTHQLAFHTSWGSNFKTEKEPAVFAKQCVHEGYGPAQPACRALMEHGAVEFSNTNAERVVTCLAPGHRWGKRVHLEQGSISLRSGTDNRGGHIRVSYADDPEMGGMVLRVAVDGY